MTEKTIPDSCRILRVIEGDGDDRQTEDFVVRRFNINTVMTMTVLGSCGFSQVFRSIGAHE